MRHSTKVFAALAAVMVVAAPARAQTITNGNFNTLGSGGSDVFATWSEYLDGNGSCKSTNNVFVGTGITGAGSDHSLGLPAFDDSHCVDVGVLEASISGLTIGNHYHLSFWAELTGAGTANNELQLFLGSTVVFDQFLSVVSWTAFNSADWVATATTTSVKVQGINFGTKATLVDNLTIEPYQGAVEQAVTTAPEPGSLILVGTGLGLVGFYGNSRRKRRNS